MTDRRAMQERGTGLRRTLAVALVANLAVAGTKMGYGELSGSVAMAADGLHALLDAGASVAGLVGGTLATRPLTARIPMGTSAMKASPPWPSVPSWYWRCCTSSVAPWPDWWRRSRRG
jgi:divalent metal cation (Fe/Co/Zn/Cd) transporter